MTKLVPFGAFVKVAEGIEGLVHISELAERHVELPEQVVSLGQEVSVKVIDVDLDRRRISLSMKQALGSQPAPASEIEREEASIAAPASARPEIAAEPDIAPEPSRPASGSDAEVAAEPAPAEVVPEPAAAEPASEEKPSEPEPALEGELLASAVAQSGESLESILQEMKRDLER